MNAIASEEIVYLVFLEGIYHHSRNVAQTSPVWSSISFSQQATDIISNHLYFSSLSHNLSPLAEHQESFSPLSTTSISRTYPQIFFKLFTTMVITTRSKKYDKVISSIVILPPEEWVKAAIIAIEEEKVSNPKGAEKLAVQLSAAFEAAARDHEHIANILRKEIDLPDFKIRSDDEERCKHIDLC
jgi:hypothetical protein